jgi:transcriptional regulator with GAF, ATPase, and Fis domain
MVSVDLGVLAAGCGQLIRSAGDARTSDEVLEVLVEVLGDILPTCEQASVTLVEHGGPRTAAASDDAVRSFDAAQYEAGEGPCLTAVSDREAVVVGHLSSDRRWPLLRQRLEGRLPVSSIMAVPIATGRAVLGSLNATSSQRDAFDPVSQQMSAVVTATAASLLLAVRDRERAEQLHQQLTHSRRRIRDINGARLRATGDLRSGLMAAGAALQLIQNRRGQLDTTGKAALDVLSEELRWHETLALELLRADVPHQRDGGPDQGVPTRTRSTRPSGRHDPG